MEHCVVMNCSRHPIVRDIGYGTTTDTWTHPDRCLDFHVFLYIIDGRFQVREDGVEYVLQPGEIFFLKKGVHHWGDPKTIEGTSWRWIHFFDPPAAETRKKDFSVYQDSSLLLPADSFEYEMVLPKRLKVSHPNYVASKMQSLEQLYLSPSHYRPLLVNLKTAELFIELHRQAQQSKPATKTDLIVGKMIEMIEQQSLQKLQSSALAEALHMNYNYLSGVFKRKMGVSVTEFHAMARINKAIELLKHPEMNISAISDRLGFPNPYHFSRVFKKVTGVSPSQYMHQIYR